MNKKILVIILILVLIPLGWIAFSMIGRVNAASVIPDSISQPARLRFSISNPVSLMDKIMSHETFDEIYNVPSLAFAVPFLDMLTENNLHKNGLLRLAARGNMELVLLPPDAGGEFAAAWDFRLLSPLLRILPAISRFVNISNLYYVQAGSNSRFEFRLDGMTLYIGPYRNLLFITDSSKVFESRSMHKSGTEGYNNIKSSSYDAAMKLSNVFINELFADQDPSIAALLNNIEFDSIVEAGIIINPRKIEFRLAAPVSSRQASINKILQQRSRVPGLAERIPANAQYATILSAGTLEELYQSSLVFSPGMDESLRAADNSSRMLLGLSLNELLFSWTGNEFAAFGLEGRPHPVYAIQIGDERKRQEIFDRAFQSIFINENVRLNLDGTRIPRIEIPEFLQSLLRRWDIFMPSPYYIIHRDIILVSESAEALLSALRAMQRNDVLPRTAEWRYIAGGRSTAESFSLYYSLDLSIPFFLRSNTALSEFLSLYRQGLARMSIDRGVVEITLSLVPGSGSGLNLVPGYPLIIGGRPVNRVFGDNGRVYFSSSGTAYSLNLADNSINELAGQGNHWIIPAGANSANAWIVTDRGRVTLVDEKLNIVNGFPILLGLRVSSAPETYQGKLYLCDEDGKVYIIQENGNYNIWDTIFDSAVRSGPTFFRTYAAVYPKSFFGELWLLDLNGKPYQNWPVPIDGIGFGSPHLFAHNNRVHVAFVDQSGELLVYNEAASLVAPFPLNLNGIFYQQPVFDGEFLWLVSSNGTFFRVSLDGEVLHQQIPGFSVMEEGYITIFDSNGDKVPEIYFTGEGNALHAYTQNFRSLEGFPLPIWGRPHFIPGQGNRKAEIIGMGMSMRLYRYQFK